MKTKEHKSNNPINSPIICNGEVKLKRIEKIKLVRKKK